MAVLFRCAEITLEVFDNIYKFLKSLKAEAIIESVRSDTVERISQLIAKTNQFKLNQNLFSVSELKKLKKNTLAVRLKDRMQDFGIVSAVVGSHTHVPTADARILAKGTGFLTDAGMCGDYDSVIGGDKEAWIRRFQSRMPVGRVRPPSGPGTACGVLIEVDPRTGLARRVAPVIQGPHLEQRWPK